MIKKNKMFIMVRSSWLMLILFFSFTSTNYTTGQITLKSPVHDKMVQTHGKELSDFLNLPMEERRSVFNNLEDRRVLYKERGPLPTTFEWNFSGEVKGPFALEISNKRDFSIPAPLLITMNKPQRDFARASVTNFYIGEKYFWRVKGNKNGKTITSSIDSFIVANQPPRLIDLPDVPNVRDMGGWVGLDGKKVRQGMIYRSSGLNFNSPKYERKEDGDPKTFPPGKDRITNAGRDYVKDDLGWKIDLDLRSDAEVGSMTNSPAGDQVEWIHNSSSSYSGIFREKGEKVMAENFRLFTNSKNYPLDFHCISGADRTGSLAMVLNGVLGVPLNDLAKDWEISAYSSFVYERRWDVLVNGMNKYGDDNTPFYVKVERYLHHIGITQEEIEKFRSIMLE